MMEFQKASKLCTFLAKDYSEDLFRLLWTYSNISASEAASRLNMHIKTIQDYLEGMTELGIVSRKEVTEKKRPYYRYKLEKKRIKLELNLDGLFEESAHGGLLTDKIRESANSSSRFSLARDGQSISNIFVWIGKGRDRRERKMNLSQPQGRFLFYLPFPSADPESISSIMEKAEIEEMQKGEIMDIVGELLDLEVIERL